MLSRDARSINSVASDVPCGLLDLRHGCHWYYGVRRHFPASQHTRFYFSYSSLKAHPIVMKSSALLSHLIVEQNVLISLSKKISA
jgi:hypothetical protein